jgi:hypothetical protein
LATDTETAAAISSHNSASDPHGDRAAATSAISTHNSATTSVHGISNTANLATQTYADSAVSTHASASNPHTGYLQKIDYTAGGKNFVTNGGFDIWQRGSSFALNTSSYTADRWQGYRSVAGSTVTAVNTSDTTNLPHILYCARVQRDSGNTSTAAIELWQAFETPNSVPLSGKTVTLSFYARKGNNFSSSSNLLNVTLATGTGTNQNPVSYTGRVDEISQSVTLTTTWQRFSFTKTLASNFYEIFIDFYYNPTGTAGAADYYEITGVQLELGSTATMFSRCGGNIFNELEICKRYYYQDFYPMISQGTNGVNGFVLGMQMRVAPSATFEYDSVINRVYKNENAARYDLVSPTVITTAGTVNTMYAFQPAGWSDTQGKGYTAFWRFSAEL